MQRSKIIVLFTLLAALLALTATVSAQDADPARVLQVASATETDNLNPVLAVVPPSRVGRRGSDRSPKGRKRLPRPPP